MWHTLLRLLLVWLAVWLLVMSGLLGLEHLAPSWPFMLRTLLLTGLMVPMITFVITPLARRIMARLDPLTHLRQAAPLRNAEETAISRK